MTRITSQQNDVVKHFVKLQKNASYRKECQSLIVEGKKLILELKDTLNIKKLLTTDESFTDPSLDIDTISSNVADKITQLKSSDGWFAECERPQNGPLESQEKLIVCDDIQDPKNLGAIIRSAVAFGFTGLLLSSDCTDVFSPKVIRSSMGHCFKLAYAQLNIDQTLAFLKKNGYKTLVAHAHGLPSKGFESPKKLALIVANEAHGPNPKFLEAFDPVTIHTQNVESLNVAIAASILMYELGGNL